MKKCLNQEWDWILITSFQILQITFTVYSKKRHVILDDSWKLRMMEC